MAAKPLPRLYHANKIRTGRYAGLDFDWFVAALDHVEAMRRGATTGMLTMKVDYFDMEEFMRDVVTEAGLTPEQRVSLIRDGLTVFTGR